MVSTLPVLQEQLRTTYLPTVGEVIHREGLVQPQGQTEVTQHTLGPALDHNVATLQVPMGHWNLQNHSQARTQTGGDPGPDPELILELILNQN